MGDESVDVDVMFIWERPSSEMNVSQNTVFESLNCTDDGDYICTAIINSPYLDDMIVLDKTETITVNCKYFLLLEYYCMIVLFPRHVSSVEQPRQWIGDGNWSICRRQCRIHL